MHFKVMPKFSEVDIARFHSNVRSGFNHECWPWKRTPTADGYGQIKVGGKSLRAHRVAYFLHYGVDPGKHLVCHDCDNPPCCNPYHLFLGTEKDNSRDCKQKGRLRCGIGPTHGLNIHPERRPRGEQVGGSKLTIDQVKQIRSLYAAGGITQEKLGEQFGVTRRAIGKIIKGQNWRHAISDNEPNSLSDPKRRGKPGEESRQAKLSESQVREIRLLYKQGKNTYKQIAAHYGVTPGTIAHIIQGLSWTHIS